MPSKYFQHPLLSMTHWQALKHLDNFDKLFFKAKQKKRWLIKPNSKCVMSHKKDKTKRHGLNFQKKKKQKQKQTFKFM